MSIYTILNPFLIYLLIALANFFVIFMNKYGIIRSYKLGENYIYGSTIIHLFLYYGIPLFLIFLSIRVTKKKNIKIVLRKKNHLILIIYVLIVVSAVGLIGLLKNMLGVYSIFDIIRLSFRSEIKHLLNVGNGFLFYSIFPQIVIIVLAIIYDNLKREKYCIFIISFLSLFLYSTAAMSRIMLLQGILYFFIIRLRIKYSNLKIKKRNIIFFFLLIMSYLVYSQGIRDYKFEGYMYTDSPIKWGISRLSDYFISTTYYTNDILNNRYDKTFPNLTLPTLNRFIDNNEYKSVISLNYVGSAEYTNLGGLGGIYSDVGMAYIIIIILVGGCTAFLWNKFNGRSLLGIMLFPIFLFNILEAYRIFFLGTELIQITIISLMLLSVIIKKYIKIEENMGEI